MTATELDAVRRDAALRVEELRSVARALWPDRDDSQVLSELLSVLSRLRAAEQVLFDLERQA